MKTLTERLIAAGDATLPNFASFIRVLKEIDYSHNDDVDLSDSAAWIADGAADRIANMIELEDLLIVFNNDDQSREFFIDLAIDMTNDVLGYDYHLSDIMRIVVHSYIRMTIEDVIQEYVNKQTEETGEGQPAANEAAA